MMRRFLKDVRGNFLMITGVAIVPIMGALALAVDYSELSRQRQATMNALDAAGIATARYIVSGAVTETDPAVYDAKIKEYARDFFDANLTAVLPADATQTVVLPRSNTGGGTLELTADLTYRPTFLPVARMLIGKASANTNVDFSAFAEVRLKNTLEVALVLDNSGSMSEQGAGTGDDRIVLLKAAAKQLVTTLAAQATQMKQVDKPVQFALVPFSASVNVGPDNDDKSWMDTTGISPVHHENFDWSTMNEANDEDKYAEFAGGAWYKRGKDWGDTENQPLTRFSLYADMKVESGREEIPNSREYICTEPKKDGTCKKDKGYWIDPDYTYITSRFSTWQGCVEARPAPYNNNDATPVNATPETLFVPMFAPDEPKHLWRLDIDGNGDIDNNSNDLNDSGFSYSNSWWADWANAGASSRQRDMRKYFRTKPYGSSNPGSGDGPNSSCTTNPITPLQDITEAEGAEIITKAIDAMEPTGNTNVPEGTAWGWRVVSGGEPFTEGRPDTEKGNDKVIIVLTDGANTYGDLGNTDAVPNRSTYAAYGYTGKGYNGTTTTRMFMDTSSDVGKADYTDSNYQEAMDEQMQMLCTNAKNAGVLVMTVSLDLDDEIDAEEKAIAALTACSSESRFRKSDDGKPAKLFWNATGSNLAEKFKEIADELSNLRIVS